ncbi:MAG TPA: sulfite reductase subunit alpha [Pseudoxanthomonas sp.]|nr:sulfite reductase subunit alpha [Pseudoxanthomonas sp.]
MSTPAADAGRAWRSWLGNAGVLLVLLLLAVMMARWQPGPWWLATPRANAWFAASVSLLAYLGLFAWTLRGRNARDVSDRVRGEGLRVVYASQTGFADLLATRSAESLRAAGLPASTQTLESIRLQDLQQGRVLFVVSTTGEGDPPDMALGFVRQVMAQAADLSGLQYAVLALGDHSYQHFCLFGRQLDEWLRQRGARALFDRVDVDNADESALRHWQHHLGQLAGATELPDWDLPRYQSWTLAERHLLNPGSVGGPVFHLRLLPPADALADWHSGDIAEVGPRHSPAQVAAFVSAMGWDAEQAVDWQEQTQTLATVLAQAHLPSLETVHGRSAAEAVAELTPLPHREYSIASVPQDGALDLVVRAMTRADGEPGLGSGWLCTHAAVGAPIALRIRSNVQFHLPVDDRPLIVIGNGTGIAGLRAHLSARVRRGHARNWLLFGERQRAHDYLFAQQLESWQAAGWLARVDLAFSRDQPQRRYVQDALRESADEVRAWVNEGAAIYVCGSLEGMAPGVDAALVQVLGAEQVDALRLSGRYRRDVY